MTEYKIVAHIDMGSLENLVNLHVTEYGWTPQGGVCYSGKHYVQAIIKHHYFDAAEGGLE